MKPSTLAVALALVGINCLGYFIFPGHTYLTSDTQIYLPMLERLWDPSLLSNDLIATNPHLSYTIYDELAIAGRKISGLGFDQVLPALHFTFRLAGITGIWLIFRAWGFSGLFSLLATACYGLGAFIHGPSVMTWELEPTPRAMALPLLWLTIGLIANNQPKWGALAAALAFLIHPPTVWPVWLILAFLIAYPTDEALLAARWKMLVIVGGSVILLAILSRFQIGEHEKQRFFATLDPSLEALQRLRASYNWVGTWAAVYWKKYVFLLATSFLAARSLKVLAPKSLNSFHLGLTTIAILSTCFSYLLLDIGKWALVPQVQFGRALQFLVSWALLGAIACGIRAAIRGKYLVAVGWLYLAYGIPVQVQTWQLFWPWSKDFTWLNLSMSLGLALCALLAAWLAINTSVWQRRAGYVAVAAVTVGSFFLLRDVGEIWVFPKLHTPELAGLSQWALESTPVESVFHFPDASQDLYPGVFRANATRAIYADWKSGGQVNFHKKLADEWWRRWQTTMAAGYTIKPLNSYAPIADFVVLKAKNKLTGPTPVYSNATYVVYQVPRN